MYEKCYNINNLQKYNKNLFIHEIKSVESENIYTYENVINETKKCLDYFQNYQVKYHAGIAVDLQEHSAATCILLLGILNHDCHFYCVDFEASKDDNAYIKATGIKYIISYRQLKADNIKQLSNDVIILKNIFYLYLLENDSMTLESKRFCYTIATSGSTGMPKIVHVPFECIEPNIKSFSQRFLIKENDMIFLGSPPTFDPFVLEFFVALANGAKILIIRKEIRLQPQQLLKIMFPAEKTLRQGVSIYQTTPSLFRLFGQESIQNVILNKNSSLRCLILGGEEFPGSSEVKSWLPLNFFSSGKRIFNVYGITEVSCWSSISELNAESLERTKVPLGSALDDLTIFRLVDDSSNVLSHKECKGELEIGSCIRRCFIPQQDNDDVKILERQDIIYRKTGDIVERDSLGNIYYIGRINNTIKRLGKRLCLDTLNKKVETLLTAHNMHFKVISLWEPKTIKLIFCLFRSQESLDNEKHIIANILKKTLDIYEQPDKVFYNKQLVLNAHGKVDSKTILQQLSATEKSPVQIFKDFLINVMGFHKGLQQHDINSSTSAANKRLKLSTNLSFLQAGGTSFQALSLATEITELLEDNLEQRKILEMLLDVNVTIEDILSFLTSCSRKCLQLNTSLNKSLECCTPSLNLKLLWRCDLKKCIDAGPSIFEDKCVSVGSHSHILLTVNALTGEEISRLEFNDRIECPVVFVTAQLAVAGCYDGFLYGFDFNNGAILWRLNAEGMIKAKPLLINNILVIASYAEEYNVLAFDIELLLINTIDNSIEIIRMKLSEGINVAAESLTLLWKSKVGSKGIFSSPVQITDETVLFCCLDGSYALLDAQTGLAQWQQKLDSPIFSTAIKIQGSNKILLILAEVKGVITICKAENGERLSTFQAAGNIFSSLTLLSNQTQDHSLIVFGCHDKNVYCLKLNHASNQLSCVAKYALNAAVYATPIVVLKKCVLACSTKGLLVLLDVLENSILASVDLKAEVFSTPRCLNDEYIYLGSRDNYLYCFQLGK